MNQELWTMNRELWTINPVLWSRKYKLQTFCPLSFIYFIPMFAKVAEATLYRETTCYALLV